MIRLTDTSRDSRSSNVVRIYCDEQTALKRLYEYENLGSVEELSIAVAKADGIKTLLDNDVDISGYVAVYGNDMQKRLEKENKELKKELEVYKRALHTALEECRYIEIEENVMPNFLEEARKELEDEK